MEHACRHTHVQWQRSSIKDASLHVPLPVLHRLDMFVRLRVMGLAGPAKVRPLEEEVAMETGADLLGEIIVFGFSVTVIALEYARQQRKEARREQNQSDQIGNLLDKVEVLTKRMDNLDQQLAEVKNRTKPIETQTNASKIKRG